MNWQKRIDERVKKAHQELDMLYQESKKKRSTRNKDDKYEWASKPKEYSFVRIIAILFILVISAMPIIAVDLPTSHYTFNKDGSDKYGHLPAIPCTIVTQGKIGNGAKGNASIIVPRDKSPSTWTLSAWIYYDDDNYFPGIVLGPSIYAVITLGKGKVTIDGDCEDSSRDVKKGWIHIVIRACYEQIGGRLIYVNGSYISGCYYRPFTDLSIGHIYDEIKIWDDTLSENDIKELYNEGLTRVSHITPIRPAVIKQDMLFNLKGQLYPRHSFVSSHLFTIRRSHEYQNR